MVILLSVLCGLSSLQLSAAAACESFATQAPSTAQSQKHLTKAFHDRLCIAAPEQYRSFGSIDTIEEIEEDELLSYNGLTLIFTDVMNAVLQAHANIYAAIATCADGTRQICAVPKSILLQVFRI